MSCFQGIFISCILVKCESNVKCKFEVNIDEGKELNLQAFQTLAVGTEFHLDLSTHTTNTNTTFVLYLI
jgi:hypothetical protein